MSLTSTASGRPRRRGAALERALLEAAWEELMESGYNDFTMDAVAVRAGTSRAVLYRRWPSKTELVRDAVAARIAQEVRAPDTGSLRGDLVAFLENASRTHALTGLALAAKLGPFYPETFSDEREFRTGHLGQETVLNELLERAAARGEIELDLLKPRVRRLVFDLYLHELMTTLRPVPDEVIASIVDDVYLPLVTASGAR
jgi:AcrR family transcriptional regulator